MSNKDDKDRDKTGLSLAEQLADADIEVSDETDEPEPEQPEPVAEEPAKSDEELFREALDQMEESDVRQAKYDDGGASQAPSSSPSDDRSDEPEDDASDVRSVHDESAGDGRLADQLSGLDVSVSEAPAEPEPSHKQPSPADDSPSEREQFEQAIDGLSRTEMRRQKYDLPTARSSKRDTRLDSDDTDSQEGSNVQDEEAARQELSRRRERRKFESAMRDVDRIESDTKYRRRNRPDPSAYFDDGQERTAEDFTTPRLPKSGEELNDIPELDDVQQGMLAQFESWKRDHDVVELNLRGETAESARERLRDFVAQSVAKDRRFIRIIPGRGVRSEGKPVLKPVVLRWLEEHAARHIKGYVPERKFGGDYGSLIVEFLQD